MTYRAWRIGQRIKEVPIIFLERTVGVSKMNKSMAAEALWICLWLRAMTVLGRL
jgi:dolichol-phosphate mannosyltransferase